MSLEYLAIIAAVIVVVLLVAAWRYTERRRRAEFRERFGPEYDRAVRERGSESAAETELAARARRVRGYDIRPLDEADRRNFAAGWRRVQARFVDDPRGAVAEADGLVGQVMQARGYPMGDFDRRAEDVSVDHPEVVDNYRSAHDLALRDERGQASTEDLRQAMVQYRTLFEDLLERDAAPDARASGSRSTAGQAR